MKTIVVSEPGSVFHLGRMKGEDETSCYPWLYLWKGKGFLQVYLCDLQNKQSSAIH